MQNITDIRLLKNKNRHVVKRKTKQRISIPNHYNIYKGNDDIYFIETKNVNLKANCNNTKKSSLRYLRFISSSHTYAT